MIGSTLTSLKIIGFFLPVCDFLVSMPKQEHNLLLEEYFSEINYPSHSDLFYKLSSKHFDDLIQKVEKKGSQAQFSPGGILLNVLYHLAESGVSTDIATAHGNGEMYSKLDHLYKIFRKKIIDLTTLQPPKLLFFLDKNDHNPVVFMTTPHKGGLSEDFHKNLPPLTDYNLALIDGHILPFPSSVDIIKSAWRKKIPIAVNCGKVSFLKNYKKDYLSLLPMISMFACNLEEAKFLTGYSDIKNCTISLQKQMMPGAQVLVTNEEKDFCMASEKTISTYTPPSFSKETYYPFGCGDAATAGFFLGNLLNLPENVKASLVAQMGCAALEIFTTYIPKDVFRDILIRHNILSRTEK